MRVIAGDFRGRRLLGPPDAATRPVTDRVKQSIFDVLAPRLAGAAVVDAFAGTGSFGIEALSRGAASCAFLERHRPAVVRLRRNLETLGVQGRCRVLTGDAFRLDAAVLPEADVVFFDPPYPLLTTRADDLRSLLSRLAGRLNDGGVVSFRHGAAVAFDVGPALAEVEARRYGSMVVRLLMATRVRDDPDPDRGAGGEAGGGVGGPADAGDRPDDAAALRARADPGLR